MNLDPIKTAYFAGLLDGEGCFYLHKKGNGLRPVVQLNMTCERTVRAIQQHFGRGTVRPKKVGSPNWAPQWIWRVYYFDALYVATTTRPHLITNAARADKILSYTPKREAAL